MALLEFLNPEQNVAFTVSPDPSPRPFFLMQMAL
jgi:hypothetical protein